MTERQLEALEILLVHPGLTAREFGYHFWPDHPMHKKSSNQGTGATTGKAGWLCAGGYLGRLRKKGWIRWAGYDCYQNELTALGRSKYREAIQKKLDDKLGQVPQAVLNNVMTILRESNRVSRLMHCKTLEDARVVAAGMSMTGVTNQSIIKELTKDE